MESLVSHHVPFCNVERRFELALTPSADEKDAVTFCD